MFRTEGVGFEPTMGFPIPVFKTGALVRSAIPPFRRILTYISVEDNSIGGCHPRAAGKPERERAQLN